MNCIHCGRRAAYMLRPSGHWLCKRHFMELFERRVKRTIRQNRLLEKDDVVMACLSGGKDSMVTLKILHDILKPNPSSRLMAVSVDEGIGGKDFRRVGKYCGELGVEHRILTFKGGFGFTMDEVMGKKPAGGILACSICGVLRRKMLNDHARGAGATKVATGHNLDDEIQTAFMNIVRGDLDRMARLGSEVGVSRVAGFVPRIKILRECLDEEVRLYADLKGIPYMKKRCPYSKKSFRTTVRRLIDSLEEKHPGSKCQMLRSVDELTAIMKERLMGQKPRVCDKCGEPSSAATCKTCQILGRLR